jgi:hypothetical protein
MSIQVVSGLPPAPPSPARVGRVPLALWVCAVSYVIDPGLRQIPVAGPPGTPCQIVRKHGGKGRKTIQWFAVGWGAKPPLPSSNTQQPNEVLADWEVGKPAEGKWLDGQDVVGVFGRYEYFLQQAPTPNDTLSFCTAPWASSPSVSVYSLSPADFSSLFVGPSVAPGGLNLIGY